MNCHSSKRKALQENKTYRPMFPNKFKKQIITKLGQTSCLPK